MVEQHKLGLGGGQGQGKHQQCEEGGETDELERDGEAQPQETSTWGPDGGETLSQQGLPARGRSGGWRRWSFDLGWPTRSEGRELSA